MLVGVLGAGAMGAGIAQVTAAAGHRVVVLDLDHAALARSAAALDSVLARDVEKGRRTTAEAGTLRDRITWTPAGRVGDGIEAAPFADCGLVVEAIVESLTVKRAAFAAVERAVAADCLLATNTSSLSVTAIAAACSRPDRVLGVHFFNPAPLMPLVELVPAVQTAAAVTERARRLVDGWGKTTVVTRDTPGFIVNRVARPFYGEALRLLEEGVADAATIDWALKELGGFRMGPFELMDLIGHDVNYAVTSTVWESLYFDPRYRPAITQRRLVDAGFLGRKAGRGFYSYAPGVERPEPSRDQALGRAIVDRVVAMLVNEAVDAVHQRVASPADVELAMTRGVNYPRGLLAWGQEIGFDAVLARIDALREEYQEDRYRASPLLRRLARSGEQLVA